MNKRNYLKVTYKYLYRANARDMVQEFTLSEARLINTILKEQSVDGKCKVELMECSQEEYKSKF